MGFDRAVIAVDDVRDEVGFRWVEIEQPKLVRLYPAEPLRMNRKAGGQ